MGSDRKGPKDPNDPGGSKQGTDSQLCVRASGTCQWMDWRGEKQEQGVPGGANLCVQGRLSSSPLGFMLL